MSTQATKQAMRCLSCLGQEIPKGWKIALFLVNHESMDGVPKDVGDRFQGLVIVIYHCQSRTSVTEPAKKYGDGAQYILSASMS